MANTCIKSQVDHSAHCVQFSCKYSMRPLLLSEGQGCLSLLLGEGKGLLICCDVGLKLDEESLTTLLCQ